MKVFVTGSTGYIGGSIAEGLIAAGHEVVGLVRSKEKLPLLKDRGITPVVGALDNVENTTRAAQDSDAVIHACKCR